jgi:hypothetical protein
VALTPLVLAPATAHGAPTSDMGLAVSVSRSGSLPLVKIDATNLRGALGLRRVLIYRPGGVPLRPRPHIRFGVLRFVSPDGRRHALTLRVLRRQSSRTNRFVVADAAGANVVLRQHEPVLLRVLLPEPSAQVSLELTGAGAQLLRPSHCQDLEVRTRIEPVAAGKVFDADARISSSDMREAGLCAPAGSRVPHEPPPEASEQMPPPAWITTRAASRWLAYGSFCWSGLCADMIAPQDRRDIPAVSLGGARNVRLNVAFDPQDLEVFLDHRRVHGLSPRRRSVTVRVRDVPSLLVLSVRNREFGSATYLAKLRR